LLSGILNRITDERLALRVQVDEQAFDLSRLEDAAGGGLKLSNHIAEDRVGVEAI
jgi:hypothetical protein